MHHSGTVVGNKIYFFGDGPVRLFFFFTGDREQIEIYLCNIKVLYTVDRIFHFGHGWPNG